MSTRTLKLSLTTVAILSIMTALALGAATFFGASLYPVRAIQQQQERLLHRLPLEGGEPIVITDIKVNDQSIFFDKKFRGDDDWMKSLAFSVKNRSDKPILLVSFFLRFLRPTGSSERTSVSELYYGNRDLAARKPTSGEQLVGLAPGQTVDIQFTSKQFQELQSFLSQTGYAPSIEKVDFMIYRVLFKDDTMWTGGGIFLRDKDDPSIWKRRDTSGLPTAWPTGLPGQRRIRMTPGWCLIGMETM